MSNDIQKADQIAYRFYSKLALVVHNARSTVENRANTKFDKWVRGHRCSLVLELTRHTV